MYKVKKAHCIYEDGKLSLVAVMWESNSNGLVRASYCTTKPVAGYDFLLPSDVLNESLLQKVSGYGMNLPDNLKKKYFPGKFDWER